MPNETELIDVSIRPVRITNNQYAELKRLAQVSKMSVAAYVANLILNDIAIKVKESN